MNKAYEITLDDLKQGEEGIIVDFLGGYKLRKRLDALGIRRGKKVTKISNMVMNGPVTIKLNNSNNIAIGRGMAKKIIVKVNN